LESKKETAPDSFWHLSEAEAISHLNCSNKGLSGKEAAQRLKTYGSNTVKNTGSSSALILFLIVH